MEIKQTDLLIIGAGPCGLFTVFEAGLLKLKCHLVDYLPLPGGQLTEIYPKKPIYDIPGYPSVIAGQLVENLMEQIKPFSPEFTLGERAESLEKLDNDFILTTHLGTKIKAKAVCIAGGLGCFEPRKPPLPEIGNFEDKGVDYIVKDPEKYRGKKLVIAGGGDSAIDWTYFLADICEELTLIHRRTEFRAAPEMVEKVVHLAEQKKIKLITESEVTKLEGRHSLESLTVHTPEGDQTISANYFLPLFGLSPKLGPIADWGLNLDKNAITVDTLDYSTNIEGIFAIGDINTYPGKLKLILCGFHEATLMVQSVFKIVNNGKKPSFKYTTVTGIQNI
ncbi:MAG TPA: NAD(P)/FAD-dependent oxidoreductase [Saprospiraceae bacterium]|nr:NAD(P)/FAD-dependent oxidoreductase [Saprospiraceae bacterium]